MGVDGLVVAAASSVEREERDWDGNEGREKSQQTNKSLSVRGWSDGRDGAARSVVVDLVGWR